MIHCLHGAVGSHHDWSVFQDRFDDELNALDLWRFFDIDEPTLAEAGHKIAAQAVPGDILLGYSMGGRLALHALLADPKRWQAAIIISAHPGLTHGHQDRLANDQAWGQLALQNWEKFLQKWNDQEILASTPEGFHQAEASDQKAVSQSFHHWSLGKQGDLRSRLHEITCPVLWISGEKDPKFTTLAAEASALTPLAVHRTISSAGHRVPWDQPEEVAHQVRSFLAGPTDPPFTNSAFA